MDKPKNKLIIYYVLSNEIDGSSAICFLESEELAKWHQEQSDVDLGKPLVGSLSFGSGSQISILSENKILTKEDYLIHYYLEGNMYVYFVDTIKFVNRFFPNGLSVFNNEIEETYSSLLEKIRNYEK